MTDENSKQQNSDKQAEPDKSNGPLVVSESFFNSMQRRGYSVRNLKKIEWSCMH